MSFDEPFKKTKLISVGTTSTCDSGVESFSNIGSALPAVLSDQSLQKEQPNHSPDDASMFTVESGTSGVGVSTGVGTAEVWPLRPANMS